jgi:hypothetical protein
MAAGLPVIALNATGIREVVNPSNGVLLPAATAPEDFADALGQLAGDRGRREQLCAGASETAQQFSIGRSAARMIAFYEETVRSTRARRADNDLHPWTALLKRVGLEWDLLSVRTQTLASAMFRETKEKAPEPITAAAGR